MESNPVMAHGDTRDAALQLSMLVVPLLKGVLYQENDAKLWHGLLTLQVPVRDYLQVLGLELVLDEAEGYAFLRSRPQVDDDGQPEQPRLIARRQLSFPVSLLLALLRKKLAEFDASGGLDGSGTRLVLSRDEIVELIRVFLPESSNETRLIDQIDGHINKVVELGFLRRLKVAAVSGKSQTGVASFEVCRILKAFVDAQWLAGLDERLKQYQAQIQDGGSGKPGKKDSETADEQA